MTPRLFIDAPLREDAAAPLSADQAHYLKSVLRRDIESEVLLFNGVDGEFAAIIIELKKKGGVARIVRATRAQTREADLTLYFAPVKRGPLETIVQKAVELGAAALQPVVTDRTVATRINIERLQSIAMEAAEQCGRLSVPALAAPIKFSAMLDALGGARRLMFCDEAGDDADAPWGGAAGRAAPAFEALAEFRGDGAPWGALIGPEGGFTPAERAALRGHDRVMPVTIGPRILRADTAAIVAIALWQASLGDWRAPE